MLHSRSTTQLQCMLEAEQWVAVDVPSTFQHIVDRLVQRSGEAPATATTVTSSSAATTSQATNASNKRASTPSSTAANAAHHASNGHGPSPHARSSSAPALPDVESDPQIMPMHGVAGPSDAASAASSEPAAQWVGPLEAGALKANKESLTDTTSHPDASPASAEENSSSSNLAGSTDIAAAAASSTAVDDTNAASLEASAEGAASTQASEQAISTQPPPEAPSATAEPLPLSSSPTQPCQATHQATAKPPVHSSAPEPAANNGPTANPSASVLRVCGHEFRLANSALILLKVLEDHLTLLDVAPQLGGEASQRTLELLKIFNTTTCQQVRGEERPTGWSLFRTMVVE